MHGRRAHAFVTSWQQCPNQQDLHTQRGVTVGALASARNTHSCTRKPQPRLHTPSVYAGFDRHSLTSVWQFAPSKPEPCTHAKICICRNLGVICRILTLTRHRWQGCGHTRRHPATTHIWDAAMLVGWQAHLCTVFATKTYGTLAQIALARCSDVCWTLSKLHC